jgi:hypothetical protein
LGKVRVADIPAEHGAVEGHDAGDVGARYFQPAHFAEGGGIRVLEWEGLVI